VEEEEEEDEDCNGKQRIAAPHVASLFFMAKRGPNYVPTNRNCCT
jgi:hypothetical protein